MIQRYKISIEVEAEWVNDALEYTKLTPKADNNGEWVKWEDVNKLLDKLGFIRGEAARKILQSIPKNPLLTEESDDTSR